MNHAPDARPHSRVIQPQTDYNILYFLVKITLAPSKTFWLKRIAAARGAEVPLVMLY
jgi:hypothetical protein